MAKALDGIRVLELAGLPGQYCGRLFADFGADVIKVEPPGGDPARALSPFGGGVRDPERSLVFLNYNANKRSVVLDIQTADGQETFRRLARTADVVIESFQPAYLDGLGLGYEQLQAVNPRIVVTSITPFGQTGPYSAYKGHDLHVQAMGGLMMIQGDDTRAPCMAPAHQGYQMASLHAAVGTMYALLARERTGRGQHVDVSMQEVIANTFFQIVRYSYIGEIERRPGVGTNLPLVGIFRCKDGGWINITPLTPGHNDTMLKWMGDPRFEGPEWRNRDFMQQHSDVLVEAMTRFMEDFDATDLVDQAQERRIPCELVALPADYARSPQLAARQYFTEVSHPVIGTHRMPGPPLRMSATPWRLAEAAPLLGEHTSAVLEGLAAQQPVGAAGGANGGGMAPVMPLEGVRVIDFTRVWVGPYATRFLADYGAEVIKIESSLFDTTTRTGRLPMAADLNRNKKSITLDLHRPQAQEIVKRLVATADIVADNFAPGVMERFGLGYEELRRIKPDIIQLTMPGWGSTGPWRDHVSYGGQVLSASGLGFMWGHPESPPSARAKFPYADFLAAVHVAFSAALALYHRRRTGEGQSIETSQQEAMGHTMGVPLLDYFVNGNPGEARGNVHLDFAPHGVYPCRGDDAWAAIACTSDEEWQALSVALESPAWASDPRFQTAAGRLEHREEIDANLMAWTLERTPKQVMYLLQKAGVPATAVQNTEDVFYDPQLRARGYLVELDHPDWGRLHHAGLSFRLSETPGAVRMPSPALGQHNEGVLMRLLGLSEAELRAAREAKAVI
jgi:crotonobetainyl-CoA:carnitine CoA-transferase CaiB-like acyl-CoA transferase